MISNISFVEVYLIPKISRQKKHRTPTLKLSHTLFRKKTLYTLVAGASPSVPCSPANISTSPLDNSPRDGGLLTPGGQGYPLSPCSPSLASGSLDNLYLGEEAIPEPTPNIGMVLSGFGSKHPTRKAVQKNTFFVEGVR